MSQHVRSDWYEDGLALWKLTLKHRQSDLDACFRLIDDALNHDGVDDFAEFCVRGKLTARALWVDSACRILQTDNRYFAAMANTDLAVPAGTDLRLPWRAFLLQWEPGLMVDSRGTDYDCALFADLSTPTRSMSAITLASGHHRDDANNIISTVAERSLPDLFFSGTNDHRDYVNRNPENARTNIDQSEIARLFDLVIRAATGVLYTMQKTRNWVEASEQSPIKRQYKMRNGPPPHRVVVIGKPIGVDLRSIISLQLQSNVGTSPSVQTLVRGHIKRQACGPSKQDRKVIWIEPYWRGPEEALILARPYAV